MENIQFKDMDNELTGGILIDTCGNGLKVYIAVTNFSSKTFKNMKAAEKYMTDFHYTRAEV